MLSEHDVLPLIFAIMNSLLGTLAQINYLFHKLLLVIVSQQLITNILLEIKICQQEIKALNLVT